MQSRRPGITSWHYIGLEIVGKWLLTGGNDQDMPKLHIHARSKSLRKEHLLAGSGKAYETVRLGAVEPCYDPLQGISLRLDFTQEAWHTEYPAIAAPYGKQ